jgi:hypothetical protein
MLFKSWDELGLRRRLIVTSVISLNFLLNSVKNSSLTELKLYNSMITPILTYGSEIWIADHKTNIENLHNLSNEKTQNMIMRQILGVHGKTSNLAIHA